MSAAYRVKHEEVKVVLIDTQYVIADPMSFKSVVQSLTGKDSCVSWIEESSFTGTKPEKRNCGEHLNGSGSEVFGGGVRGNTFDDSGAELRLSKCFSCKDLDRTILELPTMEEWADLWDSVKND